MKILFITHDFTQTGAPILLLRLIRALKSYPNIIIHTAVLYNRGSMLNEFLSCSEFHYKEEFSKIGFFTKHRIIKSEYDIIFMNTIVAGERINDLKGLSNNIVVWIHEMEFTIKYYGEQLLQNIVKNASMILVVDELTKRFVASYTSDSVFILKGCIETSLLPSNTFKKNETLDELIKIIFVATPTWRKGIYDLPSLVNRIKHLPYSIDWYGVYYDNLKAQEVLFDLHNSNNLNFLRIKGFMIDLQKQYFNYDVNLCLAHEEPGPLTILEAAVAGVPTISWDRTIGLSEFVSCDAGWLVEYLNYEAMYAVFQEISENPLILKQKGEVARQRVLKEYNSDVRAKQFLELINKTYAL